MEFFIKKIFYLDIYSDKGSIYEYDNGRSWEELDDRNKKQLNVDSLSHELRKALINVCEKGSIMPPDVAKYIVSQALECYFEDVVIL